MRHHLLSAGLGALLLSSLALAGPAIPAPLGPWVPWVLHGQEAARCPFLQAPTERARKQAGDASSSAAIAGRCAWPTELGLVLHERGGRFSQTWRMYQPGQARLPGDAARWPQGVTVNGRPAVVIARGGAPTVQLPEGLHTLAGEFRWDALPASLAVPADTGLLRVSVRGKELREPQRPEPGVLYLEQAPREEQPDRQTVELRVHRRIVDEVPLTVETRVELDVSGRNRELLLGRALLQGAVPLSLESSLPARLEQDGRLRLQVRPGRWTVTVKARQPGPVTSLTRPAPGGLWTEGDEVWVFDARSALRVVTVEGLPGVDPALTLLPPEWKSLPAYAVAEGATLTLAVKRRGDEDPAADRLALERELWLDFDGKGLTAKDDISGILSRSWRLTMQQPAQLGWVSVGAVPQVITRLAEGEPAGVEVRQGQVQVSADSRIALVGGRLPAVGWGHDFESVRAVLNLPPGWTLLHASGVDEVRTWLNRWTLLDVLLVLIISLATGRLFGVRWGLVALLTLGLSYHASGAPRLVWLAVLAGEALVRTLPDGVLRKLVSVGRLASLGVLVLVSISFAVDQVREGLNPVLERPWQRLGTSTPGADSPSAPAARMEDEEVTFYAAPPPTSSPGKSKQRRSLAQISDKFAVVQTGPGLPHWSWQQLSLRFSGPVQADQQLTLWLVPPSARCCW